jgi:TonB family protein
MRVWLPAHRSGRRLVVGIVASVLLHVLLVAGLYLARTLEPPVYKKSGEPLLVDIAPDRPKEPAPLGRPDRPVEPDRPTPQPRPAPRAATPPPRVAAPPASRPAPAPPAAKVPETPSPAPAPQVARAPDPSPTQERPSEAARADKPTIEARPEQAPRTAQPEAGAPRFALTKPSLDAPPSIFRRPGGGGGLKGGGRGGVEGEPIPLDTQDPKYADYFNQIRERIRAKWIYPREAGDRGIGGQLMIEFHISRDGRLALVELRRSSGVEILDDYALRAVQLAQPFPPVPEGLAKAVLPVSGLFTYQIVGNSFVNQYLR